tara:strand:+ start:40 stop:339 length:300 start_codon:yes stop_codon:yes gene_type:complete
MVTLDQIEKWKRDSEILTEIDEKIDVKDDWQDHEDFSCPDAFKYYVWKARKNSKQDSRYHKTIDSDSSCDKCGKIADERSLDFNLAIGFVCQTCREGLE